jgi:hypothetical protein
MPDIQRRKASAKLEADTGAVLVLSSFQSDEEKSVGEGVCRALASLWIHAGIQGTQGAPLSLETFMKVAALGSPQVIQLAQTIQDQQMNGLGAAIKGVRAYLKEKLEKFPKLDEQFKEAFKTKFTPENAKTLKEIREQFDVLNEILPGAMRDVVAQGEVDMWTHMFSLGAAQEGEDIVGFTAETYAKPVLVGNWVKEPNRPKKLKTGFYYAGIGGHALSFYFDAATSYFYDANTGLWRIPSANNGFTKFLPPYFTKMYATKYDKEHLQLLQIPNHLHDGVKGLLEKAKSTLENKYRGG